MNGYIYAVEGVDMKPMEAWEMEAVFIFTGIVILLVAGVIAWIASKAITVRKEMQEDTTEDNTTLG